MMPKVSNEDGNVVINQAKTALTIERDAIDNIINRLEGNEARQFVQAVELIMGCQGRVIVSGVGKSGHIANKIAATLASTGSPAFFVHPAEASHGDLGMVTPQDVVIALSNSGKTDELLFILPIIKRLGVKLIALTGDVASPLAILADVHLDTSVAQEACPHNLAPTASTTATLALGDALAVCVLQQRGFSVDDFARSHPGGALGRKLLIFVEDVMRSGDKGVALPLVSPDMVLKDTLMIMSAGQMGMAIVVDAQNNLLGIFTDGDLRRALAKNLDLHQTTTDSVMTRHPQTITTGELAVTAFEIMERNKVNQLVVLDASHQVVGALNMHDLLKAKVV